MNGRSPLVVVDIDVPEAELVRRLASRLVCSQCGVERDDARREAASLKCGRCGGPLVQRADDNEAVVLERLDGVQAEDASRLSTTTARGRRSARSTARRRPIGWRRNLATGGATRRPTAWGRGR